MSFLQALDRLKEYVLNKRQDVNKRDLDDLILAFESTDKEYREVAGNSIKSFSWFEFAKNVTKHIDNYTVPQYGDKGEDQASEYTVQDCINGAKKYLNRHGRNQREGQDKLDLLKAAHYIQMAFDLMDND